jgi:hypothetical protein
MASDSQQEKNGVEYTAQAANIAKGALKTGTALAGASIGAAFGPYGMAAGLAWEGRKVIAKAVIVFAALLLMPVVILTMLPSMLFAGIDSGAASDTVDVAVWDESIAEEILMNDAAVLTDNYAEACAAVDTVMQNAHAEVLSDIRADFSRYGVHDTMTLSDPYTASLPHDSTRIICEYSALTDFQNTIRVNDLRRTLASDSDRPKRLGTVTVWLRAPRLMRSRICASADTTVPDGGTVSMTAPWGTVSEYVGARLAERL